MDNVGKTSPFHHPASGVRHRSRLAHDLPSEACAGCALDAVDGLLDPLATTFFETAAGETVTIAVHGSHHSARRLERLATGWVERHRGFEPPVQSRLAGTAARIVGQLDLDGSATARRAAAQHELGVVNDLTLLIGDGDRLCAGVALWRGLHSPAWDEGDARSLASLQPLIEHAYLATRRPVPAEQEAFAALTPRERQVARLLLAGATNAEAARELQVGAETVKSHTHSILGKLGLSSRRELAIALGRSGTPHRDGGGDGDHGGRDGGGRDDGGGAGDRDGVGGDARARLLSCVLRRARERAGVVAGGCATISPRGELIPGAARGAAGAGLVPDRRLLDAVHGSLLAHVVADAVVSEEDAGSSPVLWLGAETGIGGDPQLAALAASAGLAEPAVLLLRIHGRIACLLWLAVAAGGPPGDEALRVTVGEVEPLLRLAWAELPAPGGRDLRPALPLTPRERAVARLVLGGASDAEIAAAFQISVPTAKGHVAQVLSKHRVRSRTQLIASLAARPRRAPDRRADG